MKKVLSVLCVFVLCFTCITASAAGKLNVSQENFHFIEGLWSYGYAYARVENIGDKPIAVNAGILEIYDEAGDVITSGDYISAYAKYLQPGEYTYVKIYEEIEDSTKKPNDYMLTLTGKSDNSTISQRIPCTPALEMGVVDGWWEYNYMYATITNNTDKPLYSIQVVMTLLDADGNILYIDDDNLYSERALMPGSSMIIRKDISSTFIDYFTANNITPASVDALAFVEVEVK